jgi:uncharacterized membrane protein YcaP (DUF421 family)
MTGLLFLITGLVLLFLITGTTGFSLITLIGFVVLLLIGAVLVLITLLGFVVLLVDSIIEACALPFLVVVLEYAPNKLPRLPFMLDLLPYI